MSLNRNRTQKYLQKFDFESLDVAKVTKKFFTGFEKEHGQFLKFIDGIESEFDRNCYASLILNRLMFVYFIQRNKFLDGDANYLRNRLNFCQAKWGVDTFNYFYRQFLLKLFHEGLGKPARDVELDKLLGKVPYLNSSLFEVHQLEEKYENKIQIPDQAFESVFNFFDNWNWHLDYCSLPNQQEINPDVLGYIFEKYINQKQMGAYYTNEDITEYISKNTIIPFLFDAAQKACKIAFKPDGALWTLLRENPNRYIYKAVRQGVDLELPAEIAAGIDDICQRGGWNKPAVEGFALPTETWREHVARRQRCLELRHKLAVGEVSNINDLITYNLDIRQFAQDAIANCESPDLLKALYQAIEQVSVLDPTCGSGAFLFAALNILEPLYTACLERIQGFVDEDDLRLSRETDAKPYYEKFRTTLAEMAKHPNPRYFVLKSIMLNNLYGVDIMEEATEICKLRLFLKLVAQVEPQPQQPNFGLEPLLDIDFNIRAGNTLVGFASLDEVRKAIKQDGNQLNPDLPDYARCIDEKAEMADQAFQHCRQMPTEFGMNAGDCRDSKKALRRRLAELNHELNRYLAREYGVNVNKPTAFEQWRESHQPFHWFVEFYSIINRGGFDVIIGNPPYIEYNKIKEKYALLSELSTYSTNLYSASCYKASLLKSSHGYSSFIVPVSLPSTDRMAALRVLLTQKHMIHHVSFSTRPCKLFEGAEQRLTIYIQSPSQQVIGSVFSAGYLKWYKEERDDLFAKIDYVKAIFASQRKNIWTKVRGEIEQKILDKIFSFNILNKSNFLGGKSLLYYKNTGIRYFSTVTLRPPKCYINGIPTSSSRETTLNVNSDSLHIVHSWLLSSTFFLQYQATSNCRDLNPSDIQLAPIPDLRPAKADLERLSLAAEKDYTSKGKILKMQNQKTGMVELESLTPANSKPIIDEIDRVLAQHYGFTAEELDFIINYDIKYRMGRDMGEEE